MMKLRDLEVKTIIGSSYKGDRHRPDDSDDLFDEKIGSTVDIAKTPISVVVQKNKKNVAVPYRKPIDPSDIVWTNITGGRVAVVNCSHLLVVLTEHMADVPRHERRLYLELQKSLKLHDGIGITRFFAIATGVYPKRNDIGTFVKVRAIDLNREYALPMSFWDDYKQTFLKLIIPECGEKPR